MKTPRVEVNLIDNSGKFPQVKPTVGGNTSGGGGSDDYYYGGGIGEIGLSSIYIHTSTLPSDVDGSGNPLWLGLLRDGITGLTLTPISAIAQSPYENSNGDVGYIYEFVFKDVPDGVSTTNCVTSLLFNGPSDTLHWISGAAPSMTSFFMESQNRIADYYIEPTIGQWLAANIDTLTPITEYNLALSNPSSLLSDKILISLAENAVLNSTMGGTVNFYGNVNTRTSASDGAVADLLGLSWGLNNV